MPGDQQRGLERRQRILDAALQVFSRKGYREAAVDDIADESRTSKGGVYFHFPNKQAIFVALLERTASLLLERMQAATQAERDPAGRLDAALQTVFRTFGSHRTLARLFLVEAMGAGREFDARMVEVQDAFAAVIKRHLDEAVEQRLIAPIDTRVTSVAWFGAVNQVVTRWIVTGSPSRLDDAYPPLRALLLRSVGLPVAAPERAPGRPFADNKPQEAAPDGVARAAAAADTTSGGHGASARALTSERAEVARLRERLQELAATADRPAGGALLSASVRVPGLDPLRVFEAALDAATDRCLWQDVGASFAVVGLGAAWTVEATEPGGKRFGAVAKAWKDLISAARVDAPRVPGAGPLALGGFAFDPPTACARGEESARAPWAGFPAARFVLPRLAVGSSGDETWLTVNVVAQSRDDAEAAIEEAARYWDALTAPTSFEHMAGRAPHRVTLEDDCSPEAWMRLVERAAAAIRAGELDKVVLARSATARAARPLDAGRALRHLRETSSGGGVLLAVGRDDRAFLAATPERLVSLRGGVVRADALAGSTARGGTSAEDWELGASLLASAKDQREHAVVVDYLRAALAAAGVESVAAPAAPALRKLSHLQHLHTPMTGHFLAGSVLDLVAHLHPTPAVGGAPRDAAVAYIREHEGLDRGWYAGAIGWLDREGEGEFVVGIRSALVGGATARLFTGCGIVGDSRPEAEFAESCLKLRPMIAALEAS